jgi:predicted acyl esterase
MIEKKIIKETKNCKLFGTICLPKKECQFPVVLMVHGSGPLDRNGNMPGQNIDIFNMIAQHLANNRIASLRFDKRGCGKSTGNFETA